MAWLLPTCLITYFLECQLHTFLSASNSFNILVYTLSKSQPTLASRRLKQFAPAFAAFCKLTGKFLNLPNRAIIGNSKASQLDIPKPSKWRFSHANQKKRQTDWIIDTPKHTFSGSMCLDSIVCEQARSLQGNSWKTRSHITHSLDWKHHACVNLGPLWV
jgi:hypothetical protein